MLLFQIHNSQQFLKPDETQLLTFHPPAETPDSCFGLLSFEFLFACLVFIYFSFSIVYLTGTEFTNK